MKHMIKNRSFLILKLVVTLFAVSSFYTAVTCSAKSKPEMASNRLTFPKVIHRDNFTGAIGTSNPGLAMKNSLFITVAAALVITLVCTVSAYIIVRKSNRFYDTAHYTFVGSTIIPSQSIMMLLYTDMIKWRLLNTFYGLIMTKIGSQIAFIVLFVSGFVEGIPRELEEAATIDGAGIYSILFRIVLPLTKPIILTSMMLNILNVWNDFQVPLTLLQKKTARNVPLTQCFFSGENSIELGLVLALSILSMIPILVLHPILQKYIIGGITLGAVKD